MIALGNSPVSCSYLLPPHPPLQISRNGNFVLEKKNSFYFNITNFLYTHTCIKYNMYSGGGGLVAKSCPTLVTPWIVACQTPLFPEFSRQEYWSGLPFPSPGDHPYPGVEPWSACNAGRFLFRLSYEGRFNIYNSLVLSCKTSYPIIVLLCMGSSILQTMENVKYT